MTVPCILILEDSAAVLHALEEGLSPRFCVTHRPGHDLGTLTEWLDYLHARCPSVNGCRALYSDDGNKIDVLGLNVQLCVGGVRNTNAGLSLLECLRRNFQVTAPVVLWSFRPLAQLLEEQPNLQEYGFVLLQLPVPLAGFQSAFEQALSLSQAPAHSDRGTGTARNPLQALDPQQRAECIRLIRTITNAYPSLDVTLSESLAALRQHDVSRLTALLAGAAWPEVLCSIRGLTKCLAKAGVSSNDASELSRHAHSIDSFKLWWEAHRQPSDLNGANEFYSVAAQRFRQSAKTIISWMSNGSLGE